MLHNVHKNLDRNWKISLPIVLNGNIVVVIYSIWNRLIHVYSNYKETVHKFRTITKNLNIKWVSL